MLTIRNNEYVTFKAISEGQCFEHKSDLWMKLPGSEIIRDNTTFNCVNLSTGLVDYLSEIERVLPAKNATVRYDI